MNNQDKKLIEQGNSEYAIYLHTNGNLIHKVKFVYQNDSGYFDSPFVVKVWFVRPNEWVISDYIKMLEEAKSLGVKSEALKEYLDTWAINEESFISLITNKSDINK